MSEGVEILISADDQASNVIDKAVDNVDAKVKRIKEVGGRAKASTEFVGTLANALGGTELGQYAGGLAQLTERISAFSEVSKAGGAGALLFKAGLLGVAAAAGYKLGTAIGDVIFQTQKWNEELAKATERSQQAETAFNKLFGRRLGQQTEKISLIEDPEEQRKAVAEARAKIEDDIAKSQAKIDAIMNAPDRDNNEAWLMSHDEKIKAREQETAGERQRVEMMKEEAMELAFLLDHRTAEIKAIQDKQALAKQNASYIESLQKEVELLGAANDQERASIEAKQRAGGDLAAQKEIEALLQKKSLIESTREAEKAAEDEINKAIDEKIKAQEKIEDLKKRENDRLEEQRILLTEGSEAARAFALEQQGLDKATAKSIASREEALAALSQKVETTEPQQAVQGRLLTRGRSDDTAKKSLEVQMAMKKALDTIAANTEQVETSGLIVEVGPA